MTLILNIHGRDYRVPPAIEPEPALCAAFDAAIRAQLHTAAAAAQVPKTTVPRATFTSFGEYARDAEGQVITVDESHWLELPESLHARVVVPTAEQILNPAGPVVTPAPSPTLDDEEN